MQAQAIALDYARAAVERTSSGPVVPLAVAQPADVQAIASMLPVVPGQTLTQRLAQAEAIVLDYARAAVQRAVSSPVVFRSGYRPQFVPPPTPKGFHDVDFVAYFDAVSTPFLGTIMQAGAEQLDVPLQLENDADFVLRGIRVVLFLTTERGAPAVPQVQFKAPDGSPLSSKFPAFPPLLLQSYTAGGLIVAPAGAFEFPTVPIDPEVLCPAGSAFLMNVYNPGILAQLGGFIAFFGVKRYANGC